MNRYSYVLNNPLKFIDPTGHCAGFVNQPDSPDYDEECWQYLQNEFCNDGLCEQWQEWIITSLTSIWTVDELIAIHNGLLATKAAFELSGSTNWRDELSRLRFRKVELDTPGRYDHASREIWFNSTSTFHRGRGLLNAAENAFRIVVHEIGHYVSYNNGLLHDSLPGSDESGNWETAAGYCYRKYGCESQSQGYADAFAAWVWSIAYEQNIGNLRYENIPIFRDGDTTDNGALDVSYTDWESIYDYVLGSLWNR